jgi:hypothetical protein
VLVLKSNSYADNLKRLPPAALLRQLETKEARQRLNPADRRVWVKELRKRVSRIRCAARSIVWFEDVACSGSEPELPGGVACPCQKCRQGRVQRLWPEYYFRAGKGYECWLESQSDWFLRNLPSSTSIVGAAAWRMG